MFSLVPLHFHKSGFAPLKVADDVGAFNEEVYAALGNIPEELAVLREKDII